MEVVEEVTILTSGGHGRKLPVDANREAAEVVVVVDAPSAAGPSAARVQFVATCLLPCRPAIAIWIP